MSVMTAVAWIGVMFLAAIVIRWKVRFLGGPRGGGTGRPVCAGVGDEKPPPAKN